MNHSQVINLFLGDSIADVNKDLELEDIYIRRGTRRPILGCYKKEDVLAGMKRNRSLISGYGISHY